MYFIVYNGLIFKHMQTKYMCIILNKDSITCRILFILVFAVKDQILFHWAGIFLEVALC